MRKVLYKKWFTHIYDENHKVVDGTGCHEKDFTSEGIFHKWGVTYEEIKDELAPFTVALIENPDGTIEEVLPMNIKFISE